jgi:hypothetical protein
MFGKEHSPYIRAVVVYGGMISLERRRLPLVRKG